MSVSCSLFDPAINNIEGHIWLRDQYGNLLNDHAQINIDLVENENYSTVSNSGGYWNLDDVNPGIYIIEYSKQGYGKAWQQNFQFVGNGSYIIQQDYLNELPTFGIINLDFDEEDSDNYMLRYSGTVSEIALQSRRVLMVCSRDSTYSSDPQTWLFQVPNIIYSNSESFEGIFFIGRINSNAIESGDKLYLQAFPMAYEDGEWDYRLNKTVYTTLGEPIKLKIEVP